MRTSKIGQLLNSRVKVTLQDGRVFIGQLLAHDKHLNFVLADCEEFRLLRHRNQSERRTLGMIVLRGEEVVSVSQETGAPPRGGNKARIPASITSSTGNNSNNSNSNINIPPPGAMPMPPNGLAGPMPGMFIRPGMI